MKVRFTPIALGEIDDILTYITKHSPKGAERVKARVKVVTQMLGRHPESGQLTSVPSLRRIVATPYPYLIFYQIVGGEIVIVGVRHSARDRASE